jgi:hypothetical protein
VTEQLDRRGLPVAHPEQRIELDHTQAGLLAQPFRQRAFPDRGPMTTTRRIQPILVRL